MSSCSKSRQRHKEPYYNIGMKVKLIGTFAVTFAAIASVGVFSNHYSIKPDVVVKDSKAKVQQKIDALVNRVVPDGLPGEGKRYYESLVVEKKKNYVYGETIQAVLYIADTELSSIAYEASRCEGDDTPLYTWDLLQTRIDHTKELMSYLMELNGDVDDESKPSKFNYEVIVINCYTFEQSFEYGRRTKLCSEFGLFHLPKVSGPYFSQDWYELNAKRWR